MRIEADDGLERFAVGPDVHDADLCLRQPVRRIDDRLEAHSLLEQEVVALVFGYRVQFGIRGREVHALAGEGVERLKDPLFAIFGQQVGGLCRHTNRSGRCAGGTAGWCSHGMANLLMRKYQLGWPAHSTSRSSR